MAMNNWRGWLLGGVLVLSGCKEQGEQFAQERQTTLERDNALFYQARCVEAIERRRAQLDDPQGRLPRALDGGTCESGALGDYALDGALGSGVQGSVIRLDPSRLSGYTLEVRGQDGKLYTYVDRGVAAAAAEQAGTFEETPTGDPTQAEGTTDQPQVTEQGE